MSATPARRVPLRELFTHIGIMLFVVLLGVLGFFYIYLPSTTNHNDIVTVPKVTGLKLDEIEDLLDEQNLRYEVQDSDYVSKQPPLTVVDQFPKAGERVKEDRKIFITVVAQSPPMVEMPNLLDYSLRSAQETLEDFGLTLGKLIFRPDTLRPNAVLAQQVRGRNVEPGTRVARHTPVDLVLGSYDGDAPVAVPNLIGRTVGDAESILAGLGLLRGTVTPDTLGGNAVVSRQEPAFGQGKTIRKGEQVSLWANPPKPRPVRVVAPPADSAQPAPADTTAQ